MEKYILTIAIPTYNGSKTIVNSLSTLIPQLTDDVELIVVDNCSTDNTHEIVGYYSSKYNFKYIRNEKNIGADGNFLKCLKIAHGKFVMLLSDDDLIVEGGLKKIVAFLKQNGQISCAYMDSIAFRKKYAGISNCHRYKKFSTMVTEDIVTTDKKEFLKYSLRLFGFTSSFIWSTKKINQIKNPERFFNTYFLQAYMIIETTYNKGDLLGIICGPCIAIGEYGVIGNYDMAKVEGVYYYKMIKKAINCGYPYKTMKKYYSWKLRNNVSRSVIKEKIIMQRKTELSSIIEATEGLPLTRLYLISCYYLPKGLCELILVISRKLKGLTTETYVNRPTD